MKKNFKNIEEGDNLYIVKTDKTVKINDSQQYSIYKIETADVVKVNHQTTMKKDFGGVWEKDVHTILCDIYHITYKYGDITNSISVDLTNSLINLEAFADIYVNFEDAAEIINKRHNEQRENALKDYNWSKTVIDEMNKLLDDSINTENPVVENLATAPKKNKVALFPGSFNPFTVGHRDIVNNALKIFDKVIIAFGINPDKNVDPVDLQQRMLNLKKHYKGQNVSVIKYEGLTMDIALKHKATIIRGVRDLKDFEYEKTMADINYRMGGVDTLFFLPNSENSIVSSTLVRELKKYGKDISNLIV